MDTESANYLTAKAFLRLTGIDFRHGGGSLLSSITVRWNRDIFKLEENVCAKTSNANRVGLSEHAEVSRYVDDLECLTSRFHFVSRLRISPPHSHVSGYSQWIDASHDTEKHINLKSPGGT